MPRLGAASQGESRLRMLRIVRRGDRHDPHDLTVSVRLEGDFTPAFVEGRDEAAIPGEALKALVHQAVRDRAGVDVEAVGLAVCDRVFGAQPRVTRVRAEIAEQPWRRMETGGKAHGQAFTAAGPEQRTAVVTSNGTRVAVVSGIEHLLLMRTSGLLEATRPRAADGSEDAVPPLLVGSLAARWTYSSPDVTFGVFRQGVRAALAETFARHAARTVQYTLHAMADVVLAAYAEILDVTLSLEQRPFRAADPFRAEDTPEDLFVTADEPVARVDVTLERDRPA